MSKDFHHVKLNIPAFGSSKPPLEGEPTVTIDGMPLKSVTDVSLACGYDQITRVTVTFEASVEGEALALKGVLVCKQADEPTQDNASVEDEA
jgi:hypothetical protein